MPNAIRRMAFVSNMSLRQLVTIFFPFKTTSYYHHYFEFITQTVVYKDGRAIAKVKWLIVLSIAQAVHFLYLGFELTDYERALHFDGCYLALVPKYTLNKIAFGASLMVGYFYYVLLLRPD